ncbi:MAG: DUF2219 family protein [Alphaproteobacteria bacterium]|nr:DUF2219 family protein [Alphaproteobacteria bacterium]
MAQAGPETSEKQDGFGSVLIENDLFTPGSADRHYTNGVAASWLTAPDRAPSWARSLAELSPMLPSEARVRAEWGLGQSMFTPEDITRAEPLPDERPYAGWLYLSLGLVGETETRLDQLSVSVGVVGPASLAEQTQKAVHRLTGAQDPKGWDTQLANEPALQLTYQRSWRAAAANSGFGLGADLTPHAGFGLGTVYTYANAGVTLRVGQNLPRDYGPPRVRPSLPGSGYFESRSGLGWYAFAGLDGRLVGRNVFFDGNTWQDSRSVKKENAVGDAQLGFAVQIDNVRLAYTHVWRSDEFEAQTESDVFGAFSLSIRY